MVTMTSPYNLPIPSLVMSTPTQLPTPPSDADIARLNSLAIEVPLDEIKIGSRVRRDFSHVPELAESIREDGLIQPIVLTYNKQLIAGESRIRAHRLLGRATIRAVFRGVLDEAQLGVLEATENVARQNLTWQERCLSVDKVHRLRATNVALSGEQWGVRETGKLLNQSKTNIGLATMIAEFLHANDADVWKAESIQDAYRAIIQRRENEANALIAKNTIPKAAVAVPAARFVGKPKIPSVSPEDAFDDDDDGVPAFGQGFGVNITGPDDDINEVPRQQPSSGPTVIPLSQMLLHGDAVEILKTFPAASFEHCITDWPYGIDMDNMIKNVESTAAEHDVEDNMDLQLRIIPEIFRVLKPRGFFITWTDMDVWARGKAIATTAGFSVQRWPLIWLKTSSCANQAAQYNFTKNYEIAMVCRKGPATLISPQGSSVWTSGNDVEARALGHPFAKPFQLWDWVFNSCALRGATVLDPFAGRGSSVIPAIKKGLRVTAVELNKSHYDSLVINVSQLYRALDPGVTFS